MRDVYIDIPLNIPSATLTLSPTIRYEYDDTLRRAVTIALLRKDERLYVGGQSLIRALAQWNTTPSEIANSVLSQIADRVAAYLNSESRVVSKVEIVLDTSTSPVILRVTVIKITGGTVTADISENTRL